MKSSNGLKGLLVVVVIVVLLGGWAMWKYNSLVKLNENCSSQWSKVESQYQRRMDLIPNLVATVKGYAKHEQETLTKVIEARNQAKTTLEQGDVKAIENTQTAVTSAIRDLNVVVERYPDLKANDNFKELQSQLEGTENRIATERQRYADAVQQYNRTRNVFPTNIIANMFGFNAKEYYSAQQGSENAPNVSFE
ncbi:MAG: LemA family protein [Bacteroidales bacterium]|nr:LemA family protein [Bacteroidales bacterium]